MVQLTLSDEQGRQLYADDELDALQDEMAPDALDEIGDKAMLFTGMASEKDREPPEKKSKGTRKRADSSGSA